MSKSILIVTRYGCDIKSVIKNYYTDAKIVWLQLWPSTVSNMILLKYPDISVYNSLDFSSNENHYRNAKEAASLSKNWWELLGLNEIEKELNIDGLKISNIFEEKIFKSTSTVLYCITIITNALKKLSIDKTIIVEPIRYPVNPVGVLTNYNLFELFRDVKLKDTIFLRVTIPPINQRFKKHIIQNRIYNILNKLKIFNISDVYKYMKTYKNRITSNSIVIGSSKRRLEQIIINTPKKFKITILAENKSSSNKNPKINSINYNLSNYFFNGINLKKFYQLLANVTISQYYSLEDEYQRLTKILSKIKPLVYITVDIADAKEYVRMWAMKNSKVRVVVATEAVNSFNSSLSLNLDHHYKPQLDIERWVSGKHVKETYFKYNTKVQVTGFWGNNMEPSLFPQKQKNQILLILSDPVMNSSAGQMQEDIFEITFLIKNILQVLEVYKNHTILIKPHPGDLKNIPLYKNLFYKYERVTFTIRNIYQLLIDAQIVILYQSSVLIEALHYRKNVIFYNYLKRPSYSSAVYESLNHNPELGAAVIEVNSQEQLIKAIKKLINYNSNLRSPGLEYVLKNAEPDYDVVQEIQNVLKTLDIKKNN